MINDYLKINQKINFNLLNIVKTLDYNDKTIMIYGKNESFKKIICKDIIDNNKDKTFLYVDTYFNDNTFYNYKNVLLFLDNKYENIIDYISNIEKGILDCLIIDTISSVTSEEDSWKEQKKRYELVNKYIKEIASLCYKKKIICMFLNTINYKNNASNMTQQLEKLFHLIIELNDNRIITIKRNRLSNRTGELKYGM